MNCKLRPLAGVMACLGLLFLGMLYLLLAGISPPKIKAVVEVVDQDGKPVEGAVVRMSNWWGTTNMLCWMVGIEPKNVKGFLEATTPPDGVVKISGRRDHDLSFSVTKDGYHDARAFYHTTRDFYLGPFFSTKPLPSCWKSVRLQLKEIRNPIPMHVFATSSSGSDSIHSWRFPENKPDGPVGFDFFERDLVAPHGKGLVADVMLSREAAPEKDSGSYLVMYFPNPMDGIAGPFDDMFHSKFISDHEAPIQGYKSGQKFENTIRLNFLSEQARSKGSDKHPIEGMRWHALRLRSKADPEGKIVSCHYGKVIGYPDVRVMIVKPFVSSMGNLCYYINPTENSRNLEWDTKTNLFSGVDILNVPKAP